MHYYHLFNWTIQSELKLSELNKIEPIQKVDIKIELTSAESFNINSSEKGIAYQLNSNQFLFEVDHIAKYFIKNLSEIHISIVSGADLNEVKFHFYNSVIGALCYLRGTLPIHAASIVKGEKACLLAGGAGAGKSTLAGGLCQNGGSLLSDDLSPVFFDKHTPKIAQGIPILKLWPDSIKKLNIKLEQKRKIRSSINKQLCLMKPSNANERVMLSKMFVLKPTISSEEITVEKLHGRKKLNVVLEQVYRNQLSREFGLQRENYMRCCLLAKNIEVYLINQPRKLNCFKQQVNLVLSLLEE